MTDALLSRRPHRAVPPISVLPDMALVPGRVHEFCGAARQTLALIVAGRVNAPVFWIGTEWASDPLNPDGIRSYVPPQNLTFLSPRRPEDILWCMEESLRSGAVPIVVAELPEPPGLTPVRRLHLAAETGTGAPLGLLLCPGAGGAPGVESRWAMRPRHRPGTRQWRLDRLRARTAPVKRWTLRPSEQGFVTTPEQWEDPVLAAE